MEAMLRTPKRKTIRPVFLIVIGFLAIIFLGSVLLFLPFTHREGIDVPYVDSLFMSFSATCVTGLFSVPKGLAGTFNEWGYLIVAILIQLGGLGAGVVGVFIFIVISKRLSFDQQTIIKESWNLSDNRNLRRIFAIVFAMTAVFEICGAALIFIDFYFFHSDIYEGNIIRTVCASVFTSISAFNNAGFDLFGTESILAFQNDYFLLSVLAILIISGGLGYMVHIDIFKKRFNWKKFTLQSKIVLSMTAFLIIVGGLGIFASENLGTRSLYSSGNEHMDLFNSIFLSISCRTAGFSTYNLAETKRSTLMIMMILMIIGASPGGTGGGIKTTTIFVVMTSFVSLFTLRDPNAFRRNMSKKALNRASLIFFASLGLIVVSIIVVTAFEGDSAYVVGNTVFHTYQADAVRYTTIDYLFEICSAMATVGLGTGYTVYYSVGTKIVLMILMFLGRIGPLSVSQLFYHKVRTWSYAEEEIAIG